MIFNLCYFAAMRLLALLVSMAIVMHGHAQLRDKVLTILNGDPDAPPDHDTAYIASYRSNLTFSILAKHQLVDIDIEPAEGDAVSFSTNSNEQYGVGLNFKWLSAEVSFDIPALSDPDETLGKTESRGFGLGYTGRRLWARGFWNQTVGYYLNDPQRWMAGWTENDKSVTRGDLSNETYMLSVNYALSGKRRYSQNAALFQMERQKKSAGTFVTGLSVWRTQVKADSSLLSPALVDTFQLASGFDEVNRTLIGATIGYTHTYCFWHKGFINFALLPGLTYAHQTIGVPADADIEGNGVGAVVEMKLGAGFNGDRWYSALTTGVYYSTTPIAENLNLAANYVSVRFVIGIRFGDPGIKVLEKVGL